MFLFFLEEIRASRSVVEIFDLFFSWLGFHNAVFQVLEVQIKGWFSIGFGCECGGLSKCACFIVIFDCIRCFELS